MTILYVSTTGSDTIGDGTFSNPYATINKSLSVCVNTDIIKLLDGSYNISSTTNINKQVTITSNNTNKTLVTLNANCTIFNIQESNVSITYMTLRTSSSDSLITVDKISDGSIIPTFWTGIVINNCNINYVTSALSLNGTFAITYNTFTRNSGSNVVNVIKIYSCRSTCSISNNTFTDSSSVEHVIYLTNMETGVYGDRCNSKGGTLTVASNTLTYTDWIQETSFIHIDYFNRYVYGTVGPDSQYNPNTKLSLNVNNNNITFNMYGRLIYINTLDNNDYSMYGICNINTNTIYNTDYGILHLGKNTSSHSVVSISSSDLTRSVFKIYNNTSSTNAISTPTLYAYIPFNSTVTESQTNMRASITNSGSVSIQTGINLSPYRGCAQFTGTLSPITSTNSLFIMKASTSYIIHFWVRQPSNSPAATIFSMGISYNSLGYVGLEQLDPVPSGTGNIRLRLHCNYNNINQYTDIGSISQTGNKWQSIYLYRNTANQYLELTVDGTYVGHTTCLNTSQLNNTGVMTFGSRPDAGYNHLIGYVHDLYFIKNVEATIPTNVPTWYTRPTNCLVYDLLTPGCARKSNGTNCTTNLDAIKTVNELNRGLTADIFTVAYGATNTYTQRLTKNGYVFYINPTGAFLENTNIWEWRNKAFFVVFMNANGEDTLTSIDFSNGNHIRMFSAGDSPARNASLIDGRSINADLLQPNDVIRVWGVQAITNGSNRNWTMMARGCNGTLIKYTYPIVQGAATHFWSMCGYEGLNSGIYLFEAQVFDTYLSDNDFLNNYYMLRNKWGCTSE